MIAPHELVIGDDTPIEAPSVSGGMRGLVPRPESFTSSALAPVDIPLIPMRDWPDLIREQEAKKTRLSDIIRVGNAGKPIPSKQQNEGNTGRWGYCWSYGTVGAVEALRAVMGQPYVPLSAFGVAYTIKGGRDEGAWGAMSLDFLMDRGVPSEAAWPNFARRPAVEDVWADAARHKVTSAWADLSRPNWDRDLTVQQKGSLLLARVPVVNDYPWWGHCVYSCDLVDADPSRAAEDPLRYASRDRNSWGDSYGDIGFVVIKGTRWIPGNAVAPRETLPSVS